MDEVMRDEQIGIDIIREGRRRGSDWTCSSKRNLRWRCSSRRCSSSTGAWIELHPLHCETSAGPGGEFGKSVVNIRKSIVKGIFTFFNAALGRYTTEDSQDA